MEPLPIIDSHVHFWDPGRHEYPWLQGLATLYRPFLPDDYARATAETPMAGLVFVQADCLPQQGLAEVDWVAGLSAPVLAMVGFAPLERGTAVRPVLERLKRRPLVRGVRRLIQSESEDFAAGEEFLNGVRLLAEYDLRFDICIRHTQLPAVHRLVDQCPEVRFVLDHIGKPDIAHGAFHTWAKQLRRLAGLANVACKLSGIITEAEWDNWDSETVRPYLDCVLDCFGAGRVMFGSDWPVVNLAGSFARWLDAVQRLTAHLTEAERRQVFGANCCSFYGVPEPA